MSTERPTESPTDAGTSPVTAPTSPTALVTGASSGIGAAFARHLARESYALVLVARDTERLDALAETLTEEHGVAVEVLAADLTDMRACQRVERRLTDSGRPVDLLVNNAGMGTSGRFWEVAVEDEERMLRLNVRAVMRLTHAALRVMVPRGSGDVLNVSSMAALSPMPEGGTYAASKAWVSTFSHSLHTDLAGTGVRICAVQPGLVRTEFQERAGIELSDATGPFWLDADDVVAQALHDLRCGRAISVPGRHYQAMGLVMRYAPRRALLPIYREARKRLG